MNITVLQMQEIIYGALREFAQEQNVSFRHDSIGSLRDFAIKRGLPIFENSVHSWPMLFNMAQMSEPVEPWSGEGFPPVGTVCEFMSTQSEGPHDFERVKIKYISDVTIVVRRLNAPGDIIQELLCHPQTAKFRPIRTPEQIAAEERDSEIMGMARAMMTGLVVAGNEDFKRAEKLYEAGYRKQVTP